MQFLELSLPAHDVRDSLDWYLALGFTEHQTSDVRSYPYAVVSDGHFCIGLHGQQVQAPALSFVLADVARYVREQDTDGESFDFARIGEDQFHEAALLDPDGTNVRVQEVRTFSPAGLDSDPIPGIGRLDKLALPCRRLGDSIAFWQQHGFIVVETNEPGLAELHTPGLTVELSEGTRQAALIFEADKNTQACQDFLARQNLAFRPCAEGLELRAPEGTRLVVRG